MQPRDGPGRTPQSCLGALNHAGLKSGGDGTLAKVWPQQAVIGRMGGGGGQGEHGARGKPSGFQEDLPIDFRSGVSPNPLSTGILLVMPRVKNW